MDKVAESVDKVLKKYNTEFVAGSSIFPKMEVQESEDLIRESKEVLNEVAAIDFMTATRLADNEYRKLLALSKSKEDGRLAGLKVAKAFLSKRKAQEQDAGQKNIYTQKISHIDLDIAKLNVILKRAPKKPAKPGATTPKPATTNVTTLPETPAPPTAGGI